MARRLATQKAASFGAHAQACENERVLGFRLFENPLYFGVVGTLCGVLGFRLGWRSGSRFALPLLQGLFGFFAFAIAWRVVGAIFGVLAVGGWAIGTTLYSIHLFKKQRDRIDERVLRARAYRESMFAWLRSGRGPESQPLITARTHLMELLLYLAAATLTANLLSIVMGAILLNHMNAYVSVLLLSARRKWTVRLLAWNSWSVVRVGAYIMLGSASAAPLAGWFGYPASLTRVRWLLYMGGIGVVLDLVLKLLLSRSCGRLLAGAVELGPSPDAT
jgi:hypothetical protein